MNLRPLKLGAVYHGNRMPHHAQHDLKDMAAHHMNLVVHKEIVAAAEAAYDAGARTILAWGYYGSISNDYHAENSELVWHKTCAAMDRVWNMERDRILTENRAKFMK